MQITIPRAPGPSAPTVWPDWAVPVMVDGLHMARIVARTSSQQPVYDVLYQNGSREISITPDRLRVVASGGAA